MNLENHSISVFSPAYNDAGSMGKLIKKVASLPPELTDDYEIVVVNDGSADGTGDLLNRLAHEYPFLKVIHHVVNRGYGAALITGFANCSKDLIFYTDGDGQYDVEELPLLLKALRSGVDAVNGYKISRSDPRHRIIVGSIYQRLMRLLFRLQIRDVDGDFRLFQRSLLQQIQLTYDSGMICVEMMKKFQDRHCQIVEVPVHHYHRSYGSSQFFTFRHLSRVLMKLFTAWLKLAAIPCLSRRPALPELEVEIRSISDVF
jgi:glycosyltransferase involved in cell wall biosynthesis